MEAARPQRPRKQNPPHVKLFRSNCESCGRVYEGNFPMWVRIDTFPCICGVPVLAPMVFDNDGQPWEME